MLPFAFLVNDSLRISGSGLVDPSSTICCYPLQLESFLDALAAQVGCPTMLRDILRSEICQAPLNSLSILTCNFIHRDTIIGDVTMLNFKFAAAIAAVLLMSAGAAQAGGRPFVVSGMSSSQATIVAMTIEYRRQANHHVGRLAPVPGMKFASRHRPVSKPIPTGFAAMIAERPKQTDMVTSRFNFEKPLAVGDIRFADRVFTSSISSAPRTVIPTSSLDFCVGSIAPCGAVRFAQNQPLPVPSIWIRHYISH